MKLPSINYLVNKSKESLIRFPLSILSSLILVCLGVYLVEFGDDIKNIFPYINFLLSAALGIPLYFCASIFIAKKNFNFKQRILSQIGITILIVLIYYSLPNSEETHNTSLPYIRYGVFSIIAHLLVSFIPYVGSKALNGFWNYNKILFIRFITSLLYSVFLYIGLILALTALNLLFNVEIKEELYFEFYIVIIGFFNTWFFVSGIPKDLDKLEDIREYPKGLKIFTQYILLPLLMLYLAILYAYGSKILIKWDWPKGIVSYLISCVSILGVFTLLLIHPYGNLKENSWIKKFTNIYYYILFPLIVILFIAIWIRINDYGITINRYVIVLLGIWLSIISIYFSIKRTNIKFIPISLTIILVLMSFGPWSMFSVSEISQVNRLKKMLRSNSILTSETINNEVIWNLDSLGRFDSKFENSNENILKDSIHNEVKSILDYLDDYHGFSKIRPLFKQNIDSLIEISKDSNKYFNEARIYMKTIGLKYEHRYPSGDFNYSTFSSKQDEILEISEYDYFFKFDIYYYDLLGDRGIKTFEIDGLEYTFLYDNKDRCTLFLRSENDTISVDLNQMIRNLKNQYGTDNEYNIPKDRMILKAESEILEIKIEIESISLETDVDSSKVRSILGNVFLKKKIN